MIPYDKEQTLIAIHIPKSAGTSVRKVFKQWFHPTSFFTHYYDEKKGKPPRQVDLESLARKRASVFSSITRRPNRPICIYGHFPRARGYGVESRFPEVKQFVTIMRDPFETALSTYHYLRKAGENWKDRSSIPKVELEEYLLNTPSRVLDHFPRELTRDNYEEVIDTYFVDIGLTERLEESLAHIATALGKKFDPRQLGQLNVTERTTPSPQGLRELHREKNLLEYLVYEHVKSIRY